MNDLVIDASVAIKWMFWEEGSEQALELLDYLVHFYVPDIFLIEIDAVITKKVRKRELVIEEAKNKIDELRSFPYTLVNYRDIEAFAFELSSKFAITLYDATYLAAAIDYNATFYTADLRLFNGTSNTPFNKYVEMIRY